MDTVDPQTAGFSPARLARIRPFLQGYIDRGQYAGIITLIARRDRVVHLECVGLADREAGRPMRPDTILRIYSMSKPITAVAALMLFEEGRFLLTDPLSRYIPEFRDTAVAVPRDGAPEALPAGEIPPYDLEPARREITVRDLFTHTSGLSYPNPLGSPAERLLAQAFAGPGRPPLTLAEWIPELTRVPLSCHPGTRFQYGFSTDVLGRLVEVLSGQTFDAFLQERIFGPLGMADTAFSVPPDRLDRFSAMYMPGEQGSLELVDPPTGAYSRPPAFCSGGGGLVSTTGDYLRFCQMLLNGGELDGVRLLGRKTVELMTMNHLPPPPLPSSFGGDQYDGGYGHGLGVRVLLDVARSGLPGSPGEYGWAGLAGTYFWIDPREEMIGLFMPQLAPRPGVEYGAALQFRVLAYQALE